MSFGVPSGRTRDFTGDSCRRLPHILKLKNFSMFEGRKVPASDLGEVRTKLDGHE